ncbi:CorA domain-containing protein [Rhizoctonia solani AG-1 IA]|uniref:CorA domain-containing protein n=1 Tax=Thanatephorus cucumeris (strain AG1-IA) TaxID=983506 RepID=L8XA67_THACA|nr:CorA domain-containing protein [Rhizoctonia solani AG-1 IA]
MIILATSVVIISSSMTNKMTSSECSPPSQVVQTPVLSLCESTANQSDRKVNRPIWAAHTSWTTSCEMDGSVDAGLGHSPMISDGAFTELVLLWLGFFIKDIYATHKWSPARLNLEAKSLQSNSDADENDSLTSDEEGPTRSMTTPHTHANGSTPRSPTETHTTRRTGRRRPTLAPSLQQPSRINPNDKPIDKFRTVTKMHRTQVALKDLGFGMGGQDHQGSSLPEMYGHLNVVHVWDYGPTKVNPRLFENKYEFIHWLEVGEGGGKRPLWSKVRWINVSGLSWDVLEALHHRYDLHPLSLDTVINGRQNARSKADYFPQHLFIHILSHTLTPENAAKKTAPVTQEPDPMDSPRQSKMYDPESAIGSVSYSRPPPTRATTLATTDEPYDDKPGLATRGLETEAEALASRKKEMNMKAIDALKHGTGRVEVDVRSVFMFLLRDGEIDEHRTRFSCMVFGDMIQIGQRFVSRVTSPLSSGLIDWGSECQAVTVHNEDSPPPGFLSHQSKVYLADVHDHIE